MPEHKIKLSWHRTGSEFAPLSYNRNHVIGFKGGQRVLFSAAPENGGDPAWADPEEALVASVSSCHMLAFLAAAAGEGFTVDDYHDKALGVIGNDDRGRVTVTEILLRPTVHFGGTTTPNAAQIAKLHELARQRSIIGNSIVARVKIDDQSAVSAAA